MAHDVSFAAVSTVLGHSASKAASQATLLKLPSTHQRRVTQGVMGYAEELFEMRRNQQEIKKYRRNMVDSHKFTFQKDHVTIPRQSDDYSVNEDLLGQVATYPKDDKN